ncbi:MAG: ribonuclease Y [Candidatus Portnoybacteria bacterium CG10_big_fil_rev_8_21_14_0_10_36_7]|uniref:Ribonuclease Y n=1 Tax=Candidatus Portnoybacteria bacterium CG10_big_fil_rev_8_21_14_0_10_36_7 TaxID=1974812 RepID=A0A2M8KEV0_9BACT|nr:MAG: ribonuclease Y [Candidatus Portnoybacteria bacterium CG10_big_fil_rev_8_21_14_0_10_36_7]
MFAINLLLGIGSGLFVGAILGYVTRQAIARKKAGTIEARIDKLVTEAKEEAKNLVVKAQEKSVQLLEESKREERERSAQIRSHEQRVEKKEDALDKKTTEIDSKSRDLQEKAEKIKQLREDVEKMREEEVGSLQKISHLTKEEAIEMLLDKVAKQEEKVLVERIEKMEKDGKEELEKRGRNIMVWAMQRYAASQSAEITASSVPLPSEDLKGRIIGKEGRNIKALEKLTGVEIIVDDTPGAIVISAFDPARRQIAKMALEKLMTDGRIQPARIEEAVEQASQEISKKIQEAGEAAVYDTGVVGIDPRLIRLLGRLRFRTSYGQNVLLHSLEVAHLASALAVELGLDATVAKKAGLFHDIGKAVDHEVQGSHVEIGRMILKKFNMDEAVIKAMQAHHEEYPHDTLESVLVQVADKISGSRPGARKDTLEAYIKRLEELEKVTNSFPGIEKSYAIQAGREIRGFVQPEKIDDFSAKKLARDIADRIEEDLKYPGEIKVTVIRETRVIEYAR